jgi:hypothetical protein
MYLISFKYPKRLIFSNKWIGKIGKNKHPLGFQATGIM